MNNIVLLEIKNWHDLTWDELEQYSRIRNEEYPTIINRFQLPTIADNGPHFSEKSKHWKVILAWKKEPLKTVLVGFIQLQLQEKNDRSCFFIMAVERSYQKRGIGTMLIDKAKELVDELHGWVIVEDIYFKEDGSPCPSPLQFYLKNGFTLGDERYVKEKDLRLREVTWKKR